VIKPRGGQLGKGVSVGLASPEEIDRAVERARRVCEEVVAQERVAGRAHRLLVIDHVFVAACELRPPRITGDGVRSIEKLVRRLNAEPGREIGDKSALSVVDLDEDRLAGLGYGPHTVLRDGEVLDLAVSGNPKLGGASRDVTDLVHPLNRTLAERASRAIGLDVAGVDVIAEDIGVPLGGAGGRVTGVSAGPDFRMHLDPAEGEPRDVAAPFVDLLFPSDRPVRVPVIAVTGSEGSTTAARLIAHCLRSAHYRVGLACAEGLVVDGETLVSGDLAGSRGAAIALRDASIDAAVLEVSLASILDRGLGYDLADVGVVLDARDTGETYDETRLPEDVAYAYSVVAEQVYEEGWSVLNADSDLTLEMRDRLYSRPVLFSRDPDAPEVRQHVEDGGKAAVLDGPRLRIHDGERTLDLDLRDLPPALEVVAPGVSAALYAFGADVERIREAFRTFTL
jgi:cyanophycin synthetase